MKSLKNLVGLLILFAVAPFTACTQHPTNQENSASTPHKHTERKGNPYYSRTDTNHLNVTNEEWKKILPHGVYEVGREAETERAFTGEYWNFEGLGDYHCAVCGNHLFRSDAKFASSCGWPSFYEAVRPNSVIYLQDDTYGMSRIEVKCGRCESHLGHIFDDGPPPTYKRFCMNSAVLEFVPDKK